MEEHPGQFLKIQMESRDESNKEFKKATEMVLKNFNVTIKRDIINDKKTRSLILNIIHKLKNSQKITKF